MFACADDVFVVLKHISELAGVQLAFSVLQAASGLTLSPHKCEIVPLWEALSDSTKATLRPLVARFCPLLASSPVVSHLIFLGVPVGPAVTAEMAWDPVILKMANRVRSIAASGTNVSVNCALFVKRVIPILSYISQFFPPDPRLPTLEATWVSRLWRAPGIWLSRPMLAHMMKWSKTYMQVPSLVSWSIHIRACIRTFSCLSDTCKGLASLAEEHVPLGLLIEGRISPPFWKEEALGFRLLHHLPANAPRQSLDYKAAKQCMFFPDLAGVQRRIYDRLLVLRFPVSEFSLWPRIAKTFVVAPPPFSQEVIEIFTKKAKPHAL